MVFRGVYPECHGSALGVVLEGIRSTKMVKRRFAELYEPPFEKSWIRPLRPLLSVDNI